MNVGSARGWGLWVGIAVLAGCGGSGASTASPAVEGVAEEHAGPADPKALASGGEKPAAKPPGNDAPSGAVAVAKAPAAPPAPPKRERIRMHNSCPTPLKFHLVRVSDSELQSSITNGSSIEERATDGDEVQIIGENNAIVARLKIEPSMSLVDFAQSCTALQGQ